RPKGAFLIPHPSRARNHGFGGERADEQTDRSRSRPQRDHRESASQSSYEENGSEIGGRSGQDGRSTRGDSHQIPTLNITLHLQIWCRRGSHLQCYARRAGTSGISSPTLATFETYV